MAHLHWLQHASLYLQYSTSRKARKMYPVLSCSCISGTTVQPSLLQPRLIRNHCPCAVWLTSNHVSWPTVPVNIFVKNVNNLLCIRGFANVELAWFLADRGDYLWANATLWFVGRFPGDHLDAINDGADAPAQGAASAAVCDHWEMCVWVKFDCLQEKQSLVSL